MADGLRATDGSPGGENIIRRSVGAHETEGLAAGSPGGGTPGRVPGGYPRRTPRRPRATSDENALRHMPRSETRVPMRLRQGREHLPLGAVCGWA